MAFLITAYTDIGRRQINQDAFCVRTAMTPMGEVAMAALCDGMGGADDGDKASEETIAAFNRWFNQELPQILQSGISASIMNDSLVNLLVQANDTLIRYGTANGRKLGTTASAIFAIQGMCYLIHIGDSRIYQLDNHGILQITTDHSLVAEEVRMGKITPEMARTDSRRNVLTQCIGIRGNVCPEFRTFQQKKKVSFLLCSDGFVHENAEQEMWETLNPKKAKKENKMQEGLISLTEHAKACGESDNITTVLLQIV